MRAILSKVYSVLMNELQELKSQYNSQYTNQTNLNEYNLGYIHAMEYVLVNMSVTTNQYIAIPIQAEHDINGNPRRLYLIVDVIHGSIVNIVESGYKGTDVLSDVEWKLNEGFRDSKEYEHITSMYNRINVSAKEFKGLLKLKKIYEKEGK